MGIGNVNIASTPCCGVIGRSYECYPDNGSETGWTHNPGGDYAPTVEDFEEEVHNLEQGICPDCRISFKGWLLNEPLAIQEEGRWRYSYNAAQKFFEL